jgi:hypothetical protein
VLAVRLLTPPVTQRAAPQLVFGAPTRPPSQIAVVQRDTLAALQRLQDAGAERLVLDLRDNRGGLVSEGVEIARLFLGGDALVVRTEGRARSSAAPITAPGPAASAGGTTYLPAPGACLLCSISVCVCLRVRE